jgi:hypothetical protein
MDVSHYQIAHSCLSFPLPVYPASLKPEARISPFSSFIPQIWHLSVQGPNSVFQLRELFHSGRNIGSFPSPFFRGVSIVMTSRQLFIYRCNPVYVWDGTSGSHDMRGPVSIASTAATSSEPNHNWWHIMRGTRVSGTKHPYFGYPIPR